MHGLDFLILFAVTVSVVMGFVRGLVRELIALVGLILAVSLAFHYPEWVLPYLGGVLLNHDVRVWVARIAIFVAVLITSQLIGTVVGFVVNKIPVVSFLNRILGAVFGLLRAMLVVGLLTTLGLEWRLNTTAWWQHSACLVKSERLATVVQKLSGPWSVSDLEGSD